MRWRQGDVEKSMRTTEPGLVVIRPSLEDVYRQLLADTAAGEAADLLKNAT